MMDIMLTTEHMRASPFKRALRLLKQAPNWNFVHRRPSAGKEIVSIRAFIRGKMNKKCMKCNVPLEGFLYGLIAKPIFGVKPSKKQRFVQ